VPCGVCIWRHSDHPIRVPGPHSIGSCLDRQLRSYTERLIGSAKLFAARLESSEVHRRCVACRNGGLMFSGWHLLFYCFLDGTYCSIVLPSGWHLLFSAYQTEAIPQTILIGKDGRIEVVHIGFEGLDQFRQQLTEQLKVLVDGGKIADAQ